MGGILFLLGMAGFGIGVFALFHDGILYLMYGQWDPILLARVFDNMPAAIAAWANSGGPISDFLHTTPLFAALIVGGLLLAWVGSALKRRYI